MKHENHALNPNNATNPVDTNKKVKQVLSIMLIFPLKFPLQK